MCIVREAMFSKLLQLVLVGQPSLLWWVQRPAFPFGFYLDCCPHYSRHLAFAIGSLSAASPYFCCAEISKQGVEAESNGACSIKGSICS